MENDSRLAPGPLQLEREFQRGAFVRCREFWIEYDSDDTRIASPQACARRGEVGYPFDVHDGQRVGVRLSTATRLARHFPETGLVREHQDYRPPANEPCIHLTFPLIEERG